MNDLTLQLAIAGLSYGLGWAVGFITCSILKSAKALEQAHAQDDAKVTVNDLRPRN